jgi:cytochrome c biogenesis protein CcmG/thiol:disulfide interchange protein DsbE
MIFTFMPAMASLFWRLLRWPVSACMACSARVANSLRQTRLMSSEPTKGRVSVLRWLPLALVLILFALFFTGLFMGDPTRLPSAYQGKPLPAFSLPPLHETEAGLAHADLVSGDVVLLNVWASWCAPCRDEHPLLMALAEQGIAIYGLNYKDAPKAARGFLARLGNPYRKIGVDRTGGVAIDLGVYGVPETFVLDADGTLLTRHVGPLSSEIWNNDILPLIGRAAGEQTKQEEKPDDISG